MRYCDLDYCPYLKKDIDNCEYKDGEVCTAKPSKNQLKDYLRRIDK